jgi:Flp pilus assembly protein TadD
MNQNRKAGWGRWPVLSFLICATPLTGQTGVPAAQTVAPAPSNDPADRLAANLVVLAQNPRDVNALTDAGLSAIAVGDGNAAIGFLARAEQLSPSSGRIKAALGSALILMEKPAEAIKLFSEATALGFPDYAVAKDRGLAHDLRGDPRRAQRDYALAVKHGDDDEVTRRYALSLGISGDRDAALQLLDPLLRKRDLAAWRARAFILAMTGSIGEAEGVAASIMPGNSAASMSPFLRRLASLNAADRALAVNMGIMPSDGQRYAAVDIGEPYRASSVGTSAGLVPAGDPLGPRASEQPAKRAEPVSREPRRRPGRETVTLAAAKPTAGVGGQSPPENVKDTAPVTTPAPRVAGGRINNRIGPVDPSRYPEEVRALLSPPVKASAGSTDERSAPKTIVALAGVTTLPPPSGPNPSPAVSISPPTPTAAPISGPPIAEPDPVFEVAALDLRPSAITPSPVPANDRFVPAAPAASVSPSSQTPMPSGLAAIGGLAAIIATIEPESESAAGPLPDEARLRATRLAAQRKAAADAKAAEVAKAEKDKKDAEKLKAVRHPARIWVQVATGANDAGLPLTWKRLREKAPDAFKGLQASSAPFKATNRLLVGPFKTQTDAKTVVNALSKAGISVFTFSSEAGQEIAKIASR